MLELIFIGFFFVNMADTSVPENGFNYNDSYDDVATPRSSYDVCANYIASEMVIAAKDLPLTRAT